MKGSNFISDKVFLFCSSSDVPSFNGVVVLFSELEELESIDEILGIVYCEFEEIFKKEQLFIK
jgi:hypothetical protein